MKNTPTKILIQRPNDTCRVCRENIKISGRSQVNLFRKNNEEFLSCLEAVVDTSVVDKDGVSQVLCQKCYRIVLKHHKILEQEKDVQTFRKAHKDRINCLPIVREKRCAKDSPTTRCHGSSPRELKGYCRVSKKPCANSCNTSSRSRRKLICDEESTPLENEDPFKDLDVDGLLESRKDTSQAKGNARTEVRIIFLINES